MMADPQDDSEKTLEATQHKLDKAREKGEFARSADLNTAGSYAGFLLAAFAAGSGAVERTGALMMRLLDQPDRIAPLVFSGGAGLAALGGLLLAVGAALSVFFVLPGAVALLSVLAQRSLVFATARLEPKLSRISPLENARNKFGPSGLF